MRLRLICWAAILTVVAMRAAARGQDAAPSTPNLKVPAGFSIERVAGPPLVNRPIVAAFDDDGRLYVAESSGSNDPVAKQLADKPHQILRLEDADGDGKFDRRTVFADRMMFPEGCMWRDGSLYVSAAPSIWKLTDRDGEGVADERVEWYQGKTLTGCANDLHGPYAGPDGWIYWCKGGFAEQSHEVNGLPWTSRAAHIFRSRPDGSGFEPLITGGMDNPVDVAFTPTGEAILSATFLQMPGRRDGLVHAVYGGAYGKDHDVLNGHPRTGELMPPLVTMSPAAPCGMERCDGDAFGAAFRDNFFVCEFNLRKVSRHALTPRGGSFESADSDFVTSDFVDFHPTDVLVDADGSLLVVDTGGWYKLCCPTSQLWKPDVLGGIYRVRRVGAAAIDDPRGRRIAWDRASPAELWGLMADARPAVQRRAGLAFANRDKSGAAQEFLATLAARGVVATVSDLNGDQPPARRCDAVTAALARTWALVQMDDDASRPLVRQLLSHPEEPVRHAALHAISLHRDHDAAPLVLAALQHDSAANRRAAAEALGRLGQADAVPALLAAAAKADDRVLQHSITYALIELAQPAATRAGLASDEPGVVATTLVALDQMPGGGVAPKDVIPRLSSASDELQQTARWLMLRHPEWGGDAAEWFRGQLAQVQDSSPPTAQSLEDMLVKLAASPAVDHLLSATAADPAAALAARQLALRAMARAKLAEAPAEWLAALAAVLTEGNATLAPLAVTAARELPASATKHAELRAALMRVSDDEHFAADLRATALAIVAHDLPSISDAQFAMLITGLSAQDSGPFRSAATDGLSRAPLSAGQLEQLCDAVKSAGPLELSRLLIAFKRSTDESLGRKLLAALKQAPALPSLRIDLLRQALAGYPDSVKQQVDELESAVNVDAAEQRRRIAELLPEMAKGDVRRGHAVFYSAKASCSACHRLGYAGGVVGPELTHVGQTRTERDLLESILYPSLSLVRSYEPTQVFTADGRTVNGVIQDQTKDEVVLATGPNETVRVHRDDIEEMRPSAVSVMPAGLDKQLSVQELADLVAFLKSGAGQ